jgi:streptogramin lyase
MGIIAICFVPAAAAPRRTKAVRVLYHATYPSRAARSSRTPRAAGVYAGTVTTLPAVVNQPSAFAYDTQNGYLYVVDSTVNGTAEVLRVAPSGATTRIVVLPNLQIFAITYVTATNRLYFTGRGPVTASYADAVFSLTTAGALTVAGGAESVRDGQGAAAGFGSPTGIVYDAKAKSLYVADNGYLREVTLSGKVTTVTTSGIGLPSTAALALDAVHDRLIATDAQHDEIDAVALPSGAASILSGSCLSYAAPNSICDPLERDGPAATALFDAPSGVAVSPADGTIYVADSGNNALRRIDPAGHVTTLAGNGVAAESDGAGLNAEFVSPADLALDPVHGIAYAIDTNGYSNSPGTLRAVTIAGSAPPPPATPIVLFDTHTPDRKPFALDWRVTKPATPAVLYSENNGAIAGISTAGVSAEVLDPLWGGYGGGPGDVLLGADGSQWYEDASEFGSAYIVHHTAGGFKDIALPIVGFDNNYVNSLALAPNGNVWFYDSGLLGSIAPNGKLTTYASGQQSSVASLAFAADGTLWLALQSSLAQYDSKGHLLQTIPYAANDVTAGPDGNVWFTQSDAIGTIEPNGALVVYPLYEPIGGCSPSPYTGCSRGIGAIATGPDGALWFAEASDSAPGIGRLTVGGELRDYPIFAARSQPSDVSAGPDGNLWFVDAGAQKIGRLQLVQTTLRAR